MILLDWRDARPTPSDALREDTGWGAVADEDETP